MQSEYEAPRTQSTGIDPHFGDVFGVTPNESPARTSAPSYGYPTSEFQHPDDRHINSYVSSQQTSYVKEATQVPLPMSPAPQYSAPSYGTHYAPSQPPAPYPTASHAAQAPPSVPHVSAQPSTPTPAPIHHQTPVAPPHTPVQQQSTTPSYSAPTPVTTAPSSADNAQLQQLTAQTNKLQTLFAAQSNQNREMLTQMQSYFERITRFMENVDRRLNNIETVTSDILKAQARDVQHNDKAQFERREAESAKRIADQYEKDLELARQMQKQFEQDSQKPSPTPVRPQPVATPTPQPPSVVRSPHSNEPMEMCPICGTSVVQSLLEAHVNECLDGGKSASSGALSNSAQNNANQKSIWNRMFGKNEETPTPRPAETSTPTPAPPPVAQTPSYYPGTTVRPPQPPSSSYPGYPSTFTPSYPSTGYSAQPTGQNYYYAVPPSNNGR
ncbi:hypothetical protein PROFUN_07277 [Planoprotostelium fungivorum]|uniref:UBZ4-type domain-containing protein n=1 Tax=Planoprotostelium fungivorum TaxID=1890364 RepID=A0A2P6NM32_9EUKA|nr:hypothetical protein PROFUN_07277 [Planoprotostelium fungivorum]